MPFEELNKRESAPTKSVSQREEKIAVRGFLETKKSKKEQIIELINQSFSNAGGPPTEPEEIRVL